MKLELYDTTLRDGAQQSGISLSLKDKLNITLKLDDLGIQTVEGGYAGSNPKDDEYFKLIRKENLKNVVVSAFGSTMKPNSNANEDPIVKAMLNAETKTLAVVGKSSAKQVEKVLETTLDENLRMIDETISYLVSKDRRVVFDAEHFFDGFISNENYAQKTLEVALSAGADVVVLCDTNGGMIPEDIKNIIQKVNLSGINTSSLGIHCHNDTDTAVACSLIALEQGVNHVQGTINGYGERCGNANLVSLIANLQIKKNIKILSKSNLNKLTEISKFVSDTVNRTHNDYAPYVGNKAFTHKGGMHASAVNKYVDSYQHINPEIVGNKSNITVSELAGRSNIISKLKDLKIYDKYTNDEIVKLTNLIKERESMGFSYETASASLEILLKKFKNLVNSPFELIEYKVFIQNKSKDLSQPLCEARIKILVKGVECNATAEGNGPVAALDKALRNSLVKYYPKLNEVKLTDYKVRVVNESDATESSVRVSIESANKTKTWTTVGASPNIIDASWMALSDSMEWWLSETND